MLTIRSCQNKQTIIFSQHIFSEAPNTSLIWKDPKTQHLLSESAEIWVLWCVLTACVVKPDTILLFCASRRPANAAPMVHCMHNQPNSLPYLLQTEDPGLALKQGLCFFFLSGTHDICETVVKNIIKAALHNLQSSTCQTTQCRTEEEGKQKICSHQKLEPRTPPFYPPFFFSWKHLNLSTTSTKLNLFNLFKHTNKP